MWFLVLWLIGILTGCVQLYLYSPEPLSSESISKVLLLHQFVVTFGLIAIIGLIGNVLYADRLAKKLGWPGGPFQIKYGFTQIGLGVLGIMCIWYTDHFWVATIVSMYMYGISGLWSHTQTMIVNKKADWDSIGNLIMDVTYQGFLTILATYAHVW